MDLKVIMVPFGGGDGEGGALRTAFALAREHQAHVEVWHVSPSPYNMTTVFYPGQGLAPIYSEDLVAELKKTYEDSRMAALKKFSDIAKEMDVERIGEAEEMPAHASASFHHETGDADDIIA